MMGAFLDPLPFLAVREPFLSPSSAISRTMAWFRQPSAIRSAPRRCISRSSAFPALSMKLTPHRLTLSFWRGDEVYNSRQHCSSVATRGPERLPSTLRMVLVRLVSVVMRSISVNSSTRGRSMGKASANRVVTSSNMLFFIYIIIQSPSQFLVKCPQMVKCCYGLLIFVTKYGHFLPDCLCLYYEVGAP